jgi:hypothetical protein
VLQIDFYLLERCPCREDWAARIFAYTHSVPFKLLQQRNALANLRLKGRTGLSNVGFDGGNLSRACRLIGIKYESGFN